MTVYQGFDVLEVAPSREQRQDQFQRSVVLLDNTTGRQKTDAHGAEPRPIRPFKWIAFGRAELTAQLAFMHARRGQAVPFWCPTWDEDLVSTIGLSAIDTTLTIKTIGYSQHLFPHAARRHIAIRDVSGPVAYRKVTAATDNLNGTEKLTLDSAIGLNIPLSNLLISFMPLYRLANDGNTRQWHSVDTADYTLNMVELPREVPT